ncbi:MAG: hemerythrin family protein [Spirochaetes bacterium]|nr:hemerythrin family protein [Spirochaetota bacterium]
MDSVSWTSRYETGIDAIDRQHRELFKRIDRLTLSIYDGEGKRGLGGMLEYLGTYVIEHFGTEEELLSRHGYPDLEAHKKEHIAFMTRFMEIKRECDDKGPDSYLAIRVGREIEEWWKTHVLDTDMRYVPCLRQA